MIGVLVNIVIVLVILGFLITIHELGHFLSAKFFKVKVEQFAIGFGPAIFQRKRGETLYRLNWLPIGGYVKIMGEGDELLDEKKRKSSHNFKNKSKLAQAIILLAGITMNLIFALLIYYIFIISSSYKWALSEDIKDFKPVVGTISIQRTGDIEYGSLVADGAAKKAGLPDKGKIVSVDGKELLYSSDFRNYVTSKKNQKVVLKVCNTSCNEFPVNVSNQGKVGIFINTNYIVYLDYSHDKLISGVGHGLNLLKLMGERFGSLLSQAKQTGDYAPVANNISGPIGIYLIVDAFKKYGFVSLLGLTADLSFTLAIMNILPIPALDGGRVLLVVTEAVIRRPLNKKLEAFIINTSFMLLILLMVAVLFKDVIFFKQLQQLIR